MFGSLVHVGRNPSRGLRRKVTWEFSWATGDVSLCGSCLCSCSDSLVKTLRQPGRRVCSGSYFGEHSNNVRTFWHSPNNILFSVWYHPLIPINFSGEYTLILLPRLGRLFAWSGSASFFTRLLMPTSKATCSFLSRWEIPQWNSVSFLPLLTWAQHSALSGLQNGLALFHLLSTAKPLVE